MKIVYPYPTYWPYVRRGAERCVHDLSNYLARRGHEVEIITTKPGAPRESWDGPVRVKYLRQLSHPLAHKYIPHFRLYAFGAEATAHILRGGYDVAHLWSYSSIHLAPLLRRWRGLPYLFHLMLRKHIWPSRFDHWMFATLMRAADAVAALTPGGADEIREAYGVDAISISPPVNMEQFRPVAPRDTTHPRILFPGDLGDARKGGPLVLRAWDEIHRRCPEARLILAGPFGVVGYDSEHEVYTLEKLNMIRSPSARAAVEVIGAGAVERLPYEYSRASVTVLPSVEEAFGMVVTESLACGTPVVCSSYDGPGEIVTNPEVGVTVPLQTQSDLMSERSAREFADAVLAAIELSRDPATGERCRAWSERWSLETVGRQTEEVLTAMADNRALRAA